MKRVAGFFFISIVVSVLYFQALDFLTDWKVIDTSPSPEKPVTRTTKTPEDDPVFRRLMAERRDAKDKCKAAVESLAPGGVTWETWASPGLTRIDSPDPPLHAYFGTDAIFSIAGGVTPVGYLCMYDPRTGAAVAEVEAQ